MNDFKETCLDWLGKIPAHWKIGRLKNSVESAINGVWGEEPSGDDNDIVCLRVADFDRNNLLVNNDNLTYRNVSPSDRKKKSIKHGDLLMEKSGGGDLQPVGFVVRFTHDFPAVCSNFIAKIRINESVADSNYFKYVHNALYNLRINKKSIKQTTGIQNLDQEQYFNEVVPYPPLIEQKQIAAFLDQKTTKIHDLILKKQQLIELLQEQRQAIITQAVTKGLNPDVPLKDSRIELMGHVPAHWKIIKLKFIAEVRSGVTLGRILSGNEIIEVPYLRVANVQDGYLDLSDISTIMINKHDIERYALKKGDVLMNEGGDFDKLGRGAKWNEEIDICLHQNHVFAVRPHKIEYSDWINIVTSSSYAKYYFITRSKQTTNLASISSTSIKELPVIFPPLNEQEEILTYLNNNTSKIDKLIENIQTQISKLYEYRQALITEAVTGKIDVRSYEMEVVQ